MLDTIREAQVMIWGRTALELLFALLVLVLSLLLDLLNLDSPCRCMASKALSRSKSHDTLR